MAMTRTDRRLYFGVLAPMLAAIGLLMAICVAGFRIESTVRAYVGGESLWSKGRSAAVAQLHLYAEHGDAEAYGAFRAALAVPLGDRQARLELDKPDPSEEVAAAGFLKGGNSPEDIPGLVWMYRNFRNASLMRGAIAAWAEGDVLIAEMEQLGERVRQHHGGQADAPTLSLLRTELARLDAGLVLAEKRFSSALGETSRNVSRLLIWTSLGIGLLLALASAWFVRRTLKHELDDQHALAEVTKRWELAADADGLGLFEWHVASDRLDLDERGRALYGLAPGTGSPQRADLRAVHHPGDAPIVRKDFDDAVRLGGHFRSRFRVRSGEGWRNVEATGLVRDIDRPEQARMIGILRDVTAELAQAQLRADKDLAERTAAARMAFLSRLSHELRTPLNGILGLAQLLTIDTREPLTAHQARRVKLINESGRNLLRLVEDVLDITHIDSGKVQINSVRTDLVEVLRDSLHLVDAERALRNATIAPNFPPRPMWVMGDPQRLQQVFVNLLSNACKYNRPGGLVTLDWEDRGIDMTLAIRDQGKGMSEAELAELFQAFKRFSPAPDIPGSGIGLMVVQMLVEQMGGRIEVSSQVGKGSCFTVGLPHG